MAALYPEPVQIVVRSDSDIQQIDDLAERKVSIGPPGTGTRVNALQILELHNIAADHFVEMDTASSIIELLSGNLDALFVTSALPSRYLLGAGDKIRLLSLPPSTIDALVNNHGYIPLKLPATTYSGEGDYVTTVSVTAVLVGAANLDNKLVETVLTQLFDKVDLTTYTLQASYIDKTKALQGIEIPVHAAAQQHFGKDN